MPFDETPAAMVDLEAAAAMLGMPPVFARTYLEAHGELPVATYNGRALWLSDTVHAILEIAARHHGEVSP